MLHSLVFISFNSLFIALTNIQSETHSRDRCGLAVLSPVSYFAEVISAGLSCILMQSEPQGMKGVAGGGGRMLHALFYQHQHKQHGQFSFMEAAKTTKVWNMLQHVYLYICAIYHYCDA